MSKINESKGKMEAILALFVLVISTTFFFIPILFIGLLKLFPDTHWRVICTQIIDDLVAYWIDINNGYINKRHNINWQIKGLEELHAQDWHLIVANHQSWLDIVVLHYVFNRKIPVLKFFIKDSLKWVPLLGFAWWAMGCPFMKRYSRDYLLKNPHKKGEDLEATKKALDLFKFTPSTIINFVEGTRFTTEKKEFQKSPYAHLLKPKAGGISFVIGAMGDSIRNLVDVSIVYSNEQHSLWDFLCHRISTVAITIREIPIPEEFFNTTLLEEESTQLKFRLWLNQQWADKDKIISKMRKQYLQGADDEENAPNNKTADTIAQSEQFLP